MPSAGRTSMPSTGPAPLIFTVETTFLDAGSMVTMVLPSTRPTIRPCAWAAVVNRADAATAPATAKVLRVPNIDSSLACEVDRPAGVPEAMGVVRVHRRGRCVSGGDCRELRECVAGGCRPPVEKLQRPRSRSREGRIDEDYPLLRINRARSRSQERFLSVSRLSWSFLPRATAISSLARPFSLK